MSLEYYAAGVENAYWHALARRKVLASFAARSQMECISADSCRASDVILDSGAYTAWRQGEMIFIHDYIEVAKRLVEKCKVRFVIALDVIPGRWEGKVYIPPKPGESERSMEQSLMNLEYMLSRGLKPEHLMPVFHETDPPWVLDYMLQRKFWRIGLAATISRGKPEVMEWLVPLVNRYHPSLPHPYRDWMDPKERGRFGAIPPRGIQFHLLGMGQQRILRNVPAASADSTTWLGIAKGPLANKHILRNLPDRFYELHPVARDILEGRSTGDELTIQQKRELGYAALRWTPTACHRSPATLGDHVPDEELAPWPEPAAPEPIREPVPVPTRRRGRALDEAQLALWGEASA